MIPMAPAISDHIGSLELSLHDQVNLSLIVELVSAVTPARPSSYLWSVSILKAKQSQEFRLAQTLRHYHDFPVGSCAHEVLEQSALLTTAGFHFPGKILEPLMETPILGLERGITSNSALYVFSGLVEYALELQKKITPDNLQVNDHIFPQGHLQQCSRLLQGVYQGYQHRVSADLDLLRMAQRMIR